MLKPWYRYVNNSSDAEHNQLQKKVILYVHKYIGDKTFMAVYIRNIMYDYVRVYNYYLLLLFILLIIFLI